MILPERPPHPVTGLGKSKKGEGKALKTGKQFQILLNPVFSVFTDSRTRAVKSIYHAGHDIQSFT